MKERHIPYFATASLRKVVDSLDFRKYRRRDKRPEAAGLIFWASALFGLHSNL